MSRCFPFPPPGYEPRPRNEHKDLLKKEKLKEKKHRKDKDRENRERRDNDRYHRKYKHNKKHKRDKHKERKNRGRDKDKNQTLEHKTQKSYELGNRKPEERGRNEAVKDIIPRNELVTQGFCQEGHSNHQCNSTRELLPWSTDIFGAAGTKEKERNSHSRMVKKSAQATQDNHGIVQKSDSIVYASKKGMGKDVDSKTRTKNGKNLQVELAEKHSCRKHDCNGVDLLHDKSDTQRSSEGVHTTSTVVSGAGRGVNGRIKPSPITLQTAEEGHHPEISVHSAKGKRDRISTKDMAGKENRSANNYRGKMDQQYVRDKDGAVEVKTKTEELKPNYCKVVEGKDRDRDVKKRKSGYRNKEKECEKNGNVNEQKDLGALGERENKVDDLMRLGCLNEQKFTSDDIKKRKDFELNISSHEHSMRTSKLPRMSPTNLTCADEEISHNSQGITPYSSAELAGANTCDIDRHKPQDSYNNGITGSRHLEEHIASVSSSGCDSTEGYLKPSHPDTKYLSQVHSIPTTQDLSEYIDQEWLFSKDRVERKTATFEAEESHQVWSDAQLVDTADVVALPYVVPL